MYLRLNTTHMIVIITIFMTAFWFYPHWVEESGSASIVVDDGGTYAPRAVEEQQTSIPQDIVYIENKTEEDSVFNTEMLDTGDLLS